MWSFPETFPNRTRTTPRTLITRLGKAKACSAAGAGIRCWIRARSRFLFQFGKKIYIFFFRNLCVKCDSKQSTDYWTKHTACTADTILRYNITSRVYSMCESVSITFQQLKSAVIHYQYSSLFLVRVSLHECVRFETEAECYRTRKLINASLCASCSIGTRSHTDKRNGS